MEDAFSLFGLQRRPLLDESELKEKYLRLAETRHPDLSAATNDQFHLLQDAYKTLREPAARLRHLLELQFGGHEDRDDSAAHAELFMRAGSAAHAARGVLARLENTTTSLARALLRPEIVSALKEVREAIRSVQNTQDELRERLASLDARWPDVTRAELSALASSFAFVSRWALQLSEWEFRLENR
jgi:curved DNA-binding protein CbpA